jgi:hypothetical protein
MSAASKVPVSHRHTRQMIRGSCGKDRKHSAARPSPGSRRQSITAPSRGRRFSTVPRARSRAIALIVPPRPIARSQRRPGDHARRRSRTSAKPRLRSRARTHAPQGKRRTREEGSLRRPSLPAIRGGFGSRAFSAAVTPRVAAKSRLHVVLPAATLAARKRSRSAQRFRIACTWTKRDSPSASAADWTV